MAKTKLEGSVNCELGRITEVNNIKQPVEYHIRVARHSSPAYPGDAGIYLLADSAKEAKEITEKSFPPSEYAIVSMKPL